MLYSFEDKNPVMQKNTFIAETACIIGDVRIGDRSSVWFNTVIRGDRATINIGKSTNIQDNAVVHSDENEVTIGDGVTIGHGCVMHGRSIDNNVLIGMNATILHGAEVGEYSIIGAGALVPPGYKVPARSVVLGVPCKQVRTITDEDLALIENTTKNYVKLAERYIKSKDRIK